MSDSTREEIEARRGALSDFLFTIFDMGTSPNALREADAILEMLDALASRPAPAETPSETDFWTCGRCGNLTPLDLATPPAPVGEGERRPAPATTPSLRLDPAFKADLIDFAAHQIQAVWDDVPSGVDAATLASKVVAAQEFLWMSRQVPVAVPALAEEGERQALEHLLGAEFKASKMMRALMASAILSRFTVTRKVVS